MDALKIIRTQANALLRQRPQVVKIGPTWWVVTPTLARPCVSMPEALVVGRSLR